MKITKGTNTRVIEEPVVHIELSLEEAKTLGALMRYVPSSVYYTNEDRDLIFRLQAL